jgi:SAM-dependent methyltransferase
VLDVVCGDGSGTAILARAGAAVAIGVDSRVQHVQRARDRWQQVADFALAEPHDLPLPNDAVDLVTWFEVADRELDAEAAIGELSRVVGEKGVLLLSTAAMAAAADGTPAREDLAACLETRFRNVRVYLQQAYAATLILLDGEATMRPWSPTISDDARRIAHGNWGDGTVAVVAASNGELPALPALSTLKRLVELRSVHDTIRDLRERTWAAEAEAAACRADVNIITTEREAAVAALHRTNAAYEGSLSWRITRPLRTLHDRLLARRVTG